MSWLKDIKMANKEKYEEIARKALENSALDYDLSQKTMLGYLHGNSVLNFPMFFFGIYHFKSYRDLANSVSHWNLLSKK